MKGKKSHICTCRGPMDHTGIITKHVISRWHHMYMTWISYLEVEGIVRSDCSSSSRHLLCDNIGYFYEVVFVLMKPDYFDKKLIHLQQCLSWQNWVFLTRPWKCSFFSQPPWGACCSLRFIDRGWKAPSLEPVLHCRKWVTKWTSLCCSYMSWACFCTEEC